MSFWFAAVLLGIAFMLMFTTSNLHSQTVQVSQWTIPGPSVIQGISPGPFKGDLYSVWFTDHNQGKIGRLVNKPAVDAFLSEWTPATQTGYNFQPFKIAFGWWNFSVKTMPTVLNYPPFSGIVTEGTAATVKDLTKVTAAISVFSPRPIFTIPNEPHGDGKIGMLMPNLAGGSDYFWIWDPPDESRLNNPWDIQRRSPFPLEKYAWLTDENGTKGIYQFSPLDGSLNQFDLMAQTNFLPIVFYVVPAFPKQKFTEIWLGGKDNTDNTDCIAYMKVPDKPGSNAEVIIWDMNFMGPGNFTAIVFTRRPEPKTGFNRSQVWLAGHGTPELYILKPNSLFISGGKDSLCIVHDNYYNPPWGLYYPIHLLASASDNNRRIFIPGGFGDYPDLLSANKGEVSSPITSRRLTVTPKPFRVPFDTLLALKNEQIIRPKVVEVPTTEDNIECNTNRQMWQSPAFPGRFDDALLDIDMWGRASLANMGFNYDIVWHEPTHDTAGRIGRIVTGQILASANESQWFNEETVNDFDLNQNYPNPFNPATTITYNLPKDAVVTLKVYNSLGQEVATLMDREYAEAGENQVIFNSAALPSGVYYYRIRAQEVAVDEEDSEPGKIFMSVKKMLLIR